jgi:sulfate transport system substrate-binding protein
MIKKLLLFISILCLSHNAFAIDILTISFDSNRELLTEISKSFKEYYKQNKNINVNIRQSYGGSSKQAQAVINGLKADVVNLATRYDIDEITSHDIINKNWQKSFAHNSAPYFSFVVFLVRKNNIHNIQDWNDLTKDNISIITPNPKTSGGGKYSYLSAMLFAQKTYGNEPEKTREFLQKLYSKVKILDVAARGATINFTKRKLGDVLITSESEAKLAIRDMGEDQFEIIYPSLSLKVDYPVAITKNSTNIDITTDYLNYFYSQEAINIIKRNNFHPAGEELNIKNIKLYDIEELGSWSEIQKENFVNDALFDQVIK